MSEMFDEICQALRNGQELAVATIIADGGSTPRSSGSKMIVYPNGDISGTIGGGAVEGDVIQRALRLFETRGAEIVSYDLNQNAIIERMDLICGGWIKVFIEHVPVHEHNINLYRSVREEMKRSRPFLWIGKIVDENGQWKVEHALLKGRHDFTGPLQMKHEVQKLAEAGTPIFDGPRFIDFGGTAYFVEPINPPETLFLFGAGHVAKEIAALSKKIGFRIVVFDDRAEFANANRFPGADEIFVCPDFAGVLNGVNPTSNDCIVILTRGHRFDRKVLAQALQTDAGYIGMIGSRRKRDAIYQELIRQGVQQSILDQVRCPVGLSIDAETPVEIAVSVVAQLIQQRAERRNHENG